MLMSCLMDELVVTLNETMIEYWAMLSLYNLLDRL